VGERAENMCLRKKKEEKRPVVDRGVFIDGTWVGDEASN